MPEIKIKHVVSFSSEDKVHKAENLVKPETYRKWKCATPGEKSATVVLQFEKATQITSIDIGNESSAFVEVLVGRSSDSVRDFQVLLVASSFMSPLESRNGTHNNRVRMFGPEKLAQNVKEEKWDCVQVVCTQPFNKTILYGLSFIKFHSPGDKNEEQAKSLEAEKATKRLGAFRLKYEDDDDSLSVGSLFGKQKTQISDDSSSTNDTAPSYATAVLASNTPERSQSPQNNNQKRKIEELSSKLSENNSPPPSKKPSKDNVIYKDIFRDTPQSKKTNSVFSDSKKNSLSSKNMEGKKTAVVTPVSKPAVVSSPARKPTAVQKPVNVKQKVPFSKIMDGIVFVLSGFVNPLRSELRDKALEMGAKYKGDWDSSCTHLICAFINTPKYIQVERLNGKIVKKEWILDCHRKRDKIPWRKYTLRNSSRDDSSDGSHYSAEEESESSEEFEVSEEEEEDEEFDRRKLNKTKFMRKKKPTNPSDLPNKNMSPSPPNNKTPVRTENSKGSESKTDSNSGKKRSLFSNSPQGNKSSNNSGSGLLVPKDESETEDEEALQDYMAKTDVDDDSGGDTEDEIRKVEMAQQNGKSVSKKIKSSKEDSEFLEKPDVADLPLPELPNFFKQKRFFLFGQFSSSKKHDMGRFIIAYNGIIEDYMNDKVKYVITDAKWDKNFEDALNDNEDLIFVKPSWIYKCHEAGKLVPYQPHIVIPDS